MTKKLPLSPRQRVTAGPFKIFVYGEILLVSHHRDYWISNSKVGETKLIGGNATGIVILLVNPGPDFFGAWVREANIRADHSLQMKV